jgi:inward rectifier potassium channel
MTERKIRPRLVPRGDSPRVITIGYKRGWFADLYVRSLDASWRNLAGLSALLYIAINLCFAALYFCLPGSIENARPGSFADAFFFSVQTMATIGYGKMTPSGMVANLAVAAEALAGFGYFALVAGLVFAKFSRPTARVMFSNVAVVSSYDGKPHLMFRLANQRGNRIVDARIHLTLLRNEVSMEGHTMRRFHDLHLVRNHIPLMQLTWTVMHPLDEQSPLHHISPEKLREWEAEIIVSLTGLDESFSQTIHARHSYVGEEILCDAMFEDILLRRDDGRLEVNYHKFHQVKTKSAA